MIHLDDDVVILNNKIQLPCCGVKLPIDTKFPIHCTCKDKKSRGVGDTVAKVTKAVGIKPCSACEKRREALNRMFPYKRK